MKIIDFQTISNSIDYGSFGSKCRKLNLMWKNSGNVFFRASRRVFFRFSQHSQHYYIAIIAEFEQINAGCAWETIVSDIKFVFSNSGIYNVLWAGKI